MIGGERDLRVRRDRNGDLLSYPLYYTMSYAQRPDREHGKNRRGFQNVEL